MRRHNVFLSCLIVTLYSVYRDHEVHSNRKDTYMGRCNAFLSQLIATRFLIAYVRLSGQALLLRRDTLIILISTIFMLEIHISDISLKKVNLNIIRSDTHRLDICLKTFFGVADVISVTTGSHVKILPAL